MTRTYVVGTPSDELVTYHRLSKEALERAFATIRPGALARDVHGAACDVFEAAGYPTQRTKKPGEVLLDGFFHSLGHGVGLEVHEAPGLVSEQTRFWSRATSWRLSPAATGRDSAAPGSRTWWSSPPTVSTSSPTIDTS